MSGNHQNEDANGGEQNALPQNGSSGERENRNSQQRSGIAEEFNDDSQRENLPNQHVSALTHLPIGKDIGYQVQLRELRDVGSRDWNGTILSRVSIVFRRG